jgi:hypothetical protein
MECPMIGWQNRSKLLSEMQMMVGEFRRKFIRVQRSKKSSRKQAKSIQIMAITFRMKHFRSLKLLDGLESEYLEVILRDESKECAKGSTP